MSGHSIASRPARSLGAFVCAASLAGCTSLSSEGNLLGLITPYRIDVVQGNVVTREQIALVKPGMSRTQVRDLLGSPMLSDAFHADRWDYVFTINRPGTPVQRRSIVALFDGEKLTKVVAPEDLPTEREFVAGISRTQTKGRATPLELTEEQRKALPVPPKPEAEAAEAPAGPARAYPPLEPQ
ncbi:MAG: outer membrane protein assembly factor BamE [Burkholderiaceae bacterium]